MAYELKESLFCRKKQTESFEHGLKFIAKNLRD